MTEERAYWLAWSRVPGIGPVTLKRLSDRFGDVRAAWEAPPADLRGIDGIGPQSLEVIRQERDRLDPDTLLVNYSRTNPQFWTPADPGYPSLLLETPSPPPVLHYRGRPEILDDPKPFVAIVGTRYPTAYGRRWTRTMSTALAARGFTIVSGLAAGIDAEAHRGCLDVGGKTISVLGTGVDVIYPASNRALYADIERQGLILSEYPDGTQPERGNFPARNRIIAGLSRAVLVMEAPTKSGALITARFANEFGRDVFALPGSLDNEQAVGCLGLVNRGAQLILSEGHVLELLGEMPQLDLVDMAPAPVAPPPDLDPQLADVLAVLSADSLPFDLVVQQVGTAASDVSAALLQLELFGLVVQVPGMRYRRA
ncbi:DNA protecting protein DprA [Rubidibacter lacunae KORDI 51-2]|uniref:DNA protecting protein DprA n=1 Tax=Rubidibacter lacunae KORDI 51-2 TaxID=582515 RepID=U5DLR3_9CHRO|nr:DNA-processing protein DprA [Rubidibacter lacunae]ERN41524.1 DNA protecting protein DprA [Rubidibacter lacunae KORDI 51-2]